MKLFPLTKFGCPGAQLGSPLYPRQPGLSGPPITDVTNGNCSAMKLLLPA